MKDTERLADVINRFAERHGALMLGGDDFGIPADAIDRLADHILSAGYAQRITN
ncbi:hypothetical protein [Microbacterium sp. p3-SID131]|uniref:hypothetical protein n=1 Tax=Microbacterium sp. p3-SID131 TaxID=2916215 RepID=UPI0021A4A570|nr:hypothetical protein [Microbacterium sp. p3-SID131]MCT1363338.1 hypothetical protein [Microbacterium sp. p3-SID131]